MTKINNLQNSSFETDLKDDQKNMIQNTRHNCEKKSEKVLCQHCGRTVNNGIRCLGICVADNDY